MVQEGAKKISGGQLPPGSGVLTEVQGENGPPGSLDVGPF